MWLSYVAVVFCFERIKLKDARVHAPITRIKLEIPIYFTDHSEFITDQFKKIISKAIKNEMKCLDFGNIKREITKNDLILNSTPENRL